MRGAFGSCPLCGTPVGFTRWFFGSHIWARWTCKGCGALIGWNHRARLAIGGLVFFGLLGYFLFLVVASIRPSRLFMYALLAPMMGVVMFLGTRTRVIATKSTMCKNCGYDTGGLLTCPECGTEQLAPPASTM